MIDILSEVARMTEALERYQRLDQEYLKLFEVAGYELNTDEGDAKTVEELIREVLQDPPEEPEKYIRIRDIPNYITRYLTVPADMDEFNKPTSTYNDVAYFEPDAPTAKYELTGVEWPLASEIPDGVPVIDSNGREYTRVSGNRWACLNTFDVNRPDYETTEEVNVYRPFKGIEYKD